MCHPVYCVEARGNPVGRLTTVILPSALFQSYHGLCVRKDVSGRGESWLQHSLPRNNDENSFHMHTPNDRQHDSARLNVVAPLQDFEPRFWRTKHRQPGHKNILSLLPESTRRQEVYGLQLLPHGPPYGNSCTVLWTLTELRSAWSRKLVCLVTERLREYHAHTA